MIYIYRRFLLGFIFFLIFSNFSQAMELPPDQIRGERAVKPVSVLQSRYFLKALRPEIGLLYGPILNEAYLDTYKHGFRTGMFLSEWFGLEAQFIETTRSSSDDKKALDKLEFKDKNWQCGDPETIVRVHPEINPIMQMIDFNIALAPFYGKINLLDFLIVYSDIYFSFGGSLVKTGQGDKTAMILGVGQRFYLYRSLSLRIDFRDHILQEKRSGKTTTRHVTSVDFGISYLFL